MNHKKNRLISALILFLNISLLAQIDGVKKQVPDTVRVKSILNDARMYTLKGNDSALYCAKKAKNISLKNKWTKGVANSFMEIGEYYNSKGNYELSLKNFTEGYRLHESINYRHGMSYATNAIGNMYLGWGNLKKALYNYQKSYEIADKDSNKFMMCVALFGMASVYEMNKQYSDAVLCYTKTFYYIETVPQCKDFLSGYYINISSVLNEQNKSKLAILNLHKALVIIPTNDLFSLANAYKIMGMSFSNLNNEDSAVYYFAKSEHCFLTNNALDAIQGLYLEMSNTYKKKKNYEQALIYFAKHTTYKDSVFNINKSKQIFEIEKLNENRQIKQKMSNISTELSQSKEMVRQKKHENKIIYISLSVLILCFGFIAVLFYKNYKTNLILKQKNEEKNVLVQEIHHRVKNNLQFIAAMLKMQINSIKDEGNQAVLKETSRRINSMSLVHEMLYNKEKLESVSAKDYLTELVSKLNEMVYDNKEPIKFNLSIEDVKFDINNCVAIGMITSEIISNAIKYAFVDVKNPEITLSLNYDDVQRSVVFSIHDNGIGLASNSNQSGLGMRLIDIFSRQMEAVYQSKNENGLKYIFTIPYQKNEK